MSERQRDARGRFVATGQTAKNRRPRVRVAPRDSNRAEGRQPGKRWRPCFLSALAETSNVKASADRADVSASQAYAARRQDGEFAAQWRDALCEGYENLEMDLLGYLRNPTAERKMDVANAIRLLAHHRQFVAQQRAASDDRSEQEVLASIDAMIDEMRSRAAANAALLAQIDAEAGHGA